MIIVISRVQSLHGRRDDLLAALRSYLPEVRAEPGCLECEISVAVSTPDLVQQHFDRDVFAAFARWDSVEHFLAHMDSSQLKKRLAAMQHLIADVETRVLEPASFSNFENKGGDCLTALQDLPRPAP